MLLGGALSFNLIFPSNEPDIWRLMGMWSIWMFSKLCPPPTTFQSHSQLMGQRYEYEQNVEIRFEKMFHPRHLVSL
jgi:hypothetical protein